MSSRLRALAAACAAVAIGAALIAGSASAAFPGTNGKIAFAHDPGPGPNTGIFSIDPSGQNQATLIDPPEYNDFNPSYSADGERVVFARIATPPGGGTSTIWIANQDGTNPVQLTDGTGGSGDSAPQFSPDGAKIVFERQTGGSGSAQLWTMNVDGSNESQLTFEPTLFHPHDPTYSPDGTKIALVYGDPDGSGNHGVGTINADGGGFTPLTPASAGNNEFNPDYSPDGQRIVFQRTVATDRDIYVMNADGSNVTAVTTGPELDFEPVFSPDGTRVAFERDDGPPATFGNIVTADPNALNQVTPVTNYVAPEFGFQATWQPLNPPECTVKGKATSKSLNKVTLTLTCPDENATAVLSGTGKAPDVGRGAVVSAATKFKLKKTTKEIPADQPTKVTVKVSKKGKKALKKASKAGEQGKATVKVTVTDDLGETAKAKFKVKFKAAK